MSKKTKHSHSKLVLRAHKKLIHMTQHELAFEQRLVSAKIWYRSQWLMEPYIVDFYLPNEKLVIEIDGSSHRDQEEQDASRTYWLCKRRDVCGVARVLNSEVRTVSLQALLAGHYRQEGVRLIREPEPKPGPVAKPIAQLAAVGQPRPRVINRTKWPDLNVWPWKLTY